MAGSIFGMAVRRSEDPRYLHGRGTYITNHQVPGVLHMVAVTSPEPHGRLIDIDTEWAAESPGVIGIYTAADLELRPLGTGTRAVPREVGRPPLATDRVRFVGEVVAVVLAETEQQAVDAAALVWPEIEPEPGVSTIADALADDAPILFEEVGTNLVHEARHGNTETPLDDAEVVVELSVVNQRLAAVPLEPSAALAIPREDGGIDMYVSSQNVFGHRWNLAKALGLEPDQVRTIVPDMGGGFGAKFYSYPEQIIAGKLAMLHGRPVRWTERRRQNMAGMYHGRDQAQTIRLGATKSGQLTGLQATIDQNAGGYPAFGSFLPNMTARMATGVYAIPKLDVTVRAIATNTTPTHAYRGAGRPEATALLERAMDLLAVQLGVDPVELRRKNFIREFPYETHTRFTYDSGDYDASLDRALEMADYVGLRREQSERRARGDRRQLGIGISTYVEVTAPFGHSEWGSTEVHDDGTATVRVGTSSHGQGHESAFTQIVSGVLGIPRDDITFVQGDTGAVPQGDGTGGSRSLQLGGSAVLTSAEEVLAKAKEILAHHLEASPDDIVVVGGTGLAVAGAPSTATTWAEVAQMAADPGALPDGMDPGLRAELVFEAGGSSFPFGAHVSVVEVDQETGEVELLRHIAVDDCGTIFNRVLVDGQVHGGVAQGIGQALFEEVAYDSGGNLQSGNLMTYLLPTAPTLPSFEVDHTETPSPNNPLGAKGIGESGTIGSTPAVQNAVIDAVAHLGVRHIDMPATPHRVWRAIQDAGR